MHFNGNIAGSKSMLIRALLMASHFPQLKINGDSSCDDVRVMKKAIVSFVKKEEIHCGEAGAVLRFMAFRVSREKGQFILKGSERLLSRPMEELVYVLSQLGVECTLGKNQVQIKSEGWKKPLIPVKVRRHESSQFASGLFLNAWNLPFPLEVYLSAGVSESYLQMTQTMMSRLGFQFQQNREQVILPADQKATNFECEIEPDYSTAFVVAAAAALAGTCSINNLVPETTQPDAVFEKVLHRMGAQIQRKESVLEIEKVDEFKPVQKNVHNCPDLFPCLAVLCAYAKGESDLFGAPHLAHKESDRIAKTAELLELAGIFVKKKADGIVIQGLGKDLRAREFEFDPGQDHRMAMAAGLLKLRGHEIKIKNAQVVSKSFPDFWKVIGVQP